MSMAIAVDTGNYNIKTKNFEFPANLVDNGPEEPIWTQDEDMIFMDGRYYSVNSGVSQYRRDKTVDDMYFKLTILAICKELRQRFPAEKKNDAERTLREITLLAGLPPMHMMTPGMRDGYKNYFLNRDIQKAGYCGRTYNIKIIDVQLYPQAYAAMLKYYDKLKNIPHSIIIDIGGHTVDVMALANGKIDQSHIYSLDAGTDVMLSEIKRKIQSYDILFDETTLNTILSDNKGKIDSLYLEPEVIRDIQTAVKQFVDERIFGALKRDGISLKNYLTVFVGGGSLLLKSVLEGDENLNKITIIDDTKANVTGFIQLWNASKRK